MTCQANNAGLSGLPVLIRMIATATTIKDKI